MFIQANKLVYRSVFMFTVGANSGHLTGEKQGVIPT